MCLTGGSTAARVRGRGDVIPSGAFGSLKSGGLSSSVAESPTTQANWAFSTKEFGLTLAFIGAALFPSMLIAADTC